MEPRSRVFLSLSNNLTDRICDILDRNFLKEHVVRYLAK